MIVGIVVDMIVLVVMIIKGLLGLMTTAADGILVTIATVVYMIGITRSGDDMAEMDSE